MKDRAGFFAGCADALTDMCAYYIVAGIFIMASRGWGLHLGWILLCTALCSVIFALVLRKPRGLATLTIVTGLLFAAVLAAFVMASVTPMKFGYVFVLAVGSGMAVGLPLYYNLKRPLMHNHLTHLDVLILVMIGLLLCREALGIDHGTVALMVIVLFMDGAAAVGLRMTEGGTGDTDSAFKATMVALGGAVGLTFVIGLLAVLFSRSGAVTGAVLRGIGSFFKAIFRVVERFFLWLVSFVQVRKDYGVLPMEEMGSIAELEQREAMPELSLSPIVPAVLFGIVILAAIVLLVLYLRKKTFVRGTKIAASPSNTVTRRKTGTLKKLWARLMAALRFRWTAFVRRDTPGGVLVYLERRAKRRHQPRKTGESMRQFLSRMDPTGGLNDLADALDREYYGACGRTLSPKVCRKTRHYIRKVVQHG